MNRFGFNWVLKAAVLLVVGALEVRAHGDGAPYHVEVDPSPSRAEAQAPGGLIEVGSLGDLVVHSEGRLQPLDSFARHVLLQLSSRSRHGNESALAWLARLLFDPGSVGDDEVFRVVSPGILDAIGMSRRVKEKRRYSFNEIAPHFSDLADLNSALEAKQQQSSEGLNSFEKEVVKLYHNFLNYLFLSGSFSFAHRVSHPALGDASMRKTLNLPGEKKSMTLWEVYEGHHPHLMVLMGTYSKIDTNRFMEEDWVVLSFIEHIFKAFDAGQGRRFLRIVPFKHREGEVTGSNASPLRWTSPWQVVSLYRLSPKDHDELFKDVVLPLHEASKAFVAGNQRVFDEQINMFKRAVSERAEPSSSRSFRAIKSEFFYNQLNPLSRAKLAYVVAFVLLLVSQIRFRRILGRGALALLLLGGAFHVAAIGLRMFVMSRPPIANLYETFVFVSLMTVAMGLATERFRLKGLGLTAGSVGGALFLFIAEVFHSQGDTMGVLIAVLRSNFWLSTHVIAINLGYGGVIFSGLLAHLYLFGRLFSVGAATKNPPALMPFVKGTQGFGLLFTFVGTFLGGVWADQSWGRFWGWDPKENGAILIVLWSGMMFHARMAGLIKNLGFAAGAVLNVIVVMLAWFGINLLGVGLHSYGFTSGLAMGLFVYIGLQMSLLFLLLYLIQRREDLARAKLSHGD